MISPLLTVDSLKVHFFTEFAVIKAVEEVSFETMPGETLGLVGESGCGKTVTGLSILRLIPSPPGRITAGRIIFNGTSLLDISEIEMRKIRGNKISMIFQEPMTSLNPVFTVGDQIVEAITVHETVSKREAKDRTIELLNLVGIPNAHERFFSYPHQLSGGMRQRVMIAMALACSPHLLIADEPTTALDVTIQAQILELLGELKERLRMSLIFITHDLGVVAQIADRIAVMYAGRMFEYGNVRQIFKNPRNPYTKGLLKSIPVLQQDNRRLQVIPGEVPDPSNLPQGCKFYPRCYLTKPECQKGEPIFQVEEGHWSRCIRWKEV